MMTPAFARQKYVVIIAALLAAAVLVALAVVLYVGMPVSGPAPTNFEECARLYKVVGTMPRTCKVPWGKTFVEYDGNATTVGDDVRLDLVPAAVFNKQPIKFSGIAKDDWFNAQGVLDIKLVGSTGAVLVQTTSSAAPAGTPAAPGYKAFSVELTFPPQAAGSQGALVITKPGGAQSLVTPIAF